MRSERKQKHKHVSRLSAVDSENIGVSKPSSSRKVCNKRNKRKARKISKRQTRKQNLTVQKVLANKLKGKQREDIRLCEAVVEVGNGSMPKVMETPQISHIRRGGDFKKTRDDRQQRRLYLRNNRLNNRSSLGSNTTTASQKITKKLLRAIKRRQLQNDNSKYLERRNKLKRKLNLTNNSKNESEVSTLLNNSLEEGEIISDDEVNKSPSTNNSSTVMGEDNDDDCICIEPQIEKIVIDDDEPVTSRTIAKNNISSGYVSIIQSVNDRQSRLAGQLLTSTPYDEGPIRSVVQNSTQNIEQDHLSDVSSLFYEDVSRNNFLESINSEDTFISYTRMSNLVRNHKSKAGKRRKNKSRKDTSTSEDVIILEDIVNDTTQKVTEKENEMDDSVIFISETVGKSDKPAPMLDFVPLSSDDVPNPIIVPKSPPRTPRRAAIKSGLFTNSERKELVAYNNNTYNPNADDPKAAEKQSKKRLILIDGCNVAFNHALNKEFSVKGLKICIEYFEKMGHEVKAVVPQFRMHRCSESSAMFELHRAGKIVVTPCKNLPGKFTISYDDRFILQLASEIDAAIVSNDNYRDLINENSAFKKLIENRVIGFTWCNDLFMVAKDPYGKWGPSLQTILNRT
ncbi:uncharacterized protein LOC129243630 isoform X1 [Anastrepha obliqua]|uniref:uncharacterized protein LOC129243630 isoform X1 n=1 Tax=Anastrepha obliqua TaxID=95512 RepID=UPI00240A98DD|nr:uncharacterized protein LOC129243630 isoform X1 [Anastrepha obliqua]